jgi:glycosyltransferase involved in cell wall biosynthesis
MNDEGDTRHLGRSVTSSVAVVVPTVAGREAALRRCLAAIENQSLAPAEVRVVTGRDSVISAIRSGIENTSADWIAFTDDDAVPDRLWLQTLAEHFDPSVGAVGGRIENFVAGQLTATEYAHGPVARIGWFGRLRSHLHDVPLERIVEDVDHLPGANMCFRRAALPALEARLDRGMAPGFETALCLAVRHSGWRVVFDSDAVVAHYPEPRPPHLSREDNERSVYEYSYLLMYAMGRYLPWPRKVSFFAYFVLVGQRRSPGLLLLPLYVRNPVLRRQLRAAWAGKSAGLRATFGWTA